MVGQFRTHCFQWGVRRICLRILKKKLVWLFSAPIPTQKPILKQIGYGGLTFSSFWVIWHGMTPMPITVTRVLQSRLFCRLWVKENHNRIVNKSNLVNPTLCNTFTITIVYLHHHLDIITRKGDVRECSWEFPKSHTGNKFLSSFLS